MACRGCQERRRIIAASVEKHGVVTGTVQAAPKVAQHLIRSRLTRRRTPRNRQAEGQANAQDQDPQST